jgi:hypothetical protein
VLGTYLPEDRAYWAADPRRLDAYDIVIVLRDAPEVHYLRMERRQVTTFHDYLHEYLICQRLP